MILVRHPLLAAEDVILMCGDHVVLTKASKATYGLDWFFASLDGKSVSGLCLLSLSLLRVKHRMSYPVVTAQGDKPAEARAHDPAMQQASGR